MKTALWAFLFALLSAYTYSIAITHQDIAHAFAYDGTSRVVFERRVVERTPFWAHIYRRTVVREYDVCRISAEAVAALPYRAFSARGTVNIAGTPTLFLKAAAMQERQDLVRSNVFDCETVRVPFWAFGIFTGGASVS